MKHIKDTEGITPTPQFIAKQYTGEFFQVLPGIYMIKGAKNSRGFDQAYAIKKRNREEYILIDAVGMATKDAVDQLLKNGHKIEAILITSNSVLRDAYADLATISEDAGGAAIYVHPETNVQEKFETSDLLNSDALLSSYDLEIDHLPASRNGEVLIYCNRHNGILFTGDTAKGSAWDTDEFTFTRDEIDTQKLDFEMGENFMMYEKDFIYLFPRQGKPGIEVDGGTRTDILNKLRKGS